MRNEQFMRNWTQAQPIVAAYIGSLVPAFHEAEDILQNVSVILLRKFADYDPHRPFIAWTLGIARLEVLAARRAGSRNVLVSHPELVEAVAEQYAEMTPELEARAIALKRCLQGLGSRALQMLKLRYEGSLHPREIAIRLGMAAGAVRTALSRVRSSLHDCIERGLAGAARQP